MYKSSIVLLLQLKQLYTPPLLLDTQYMQTFTLLKKKKPLGFFFYKVKVRMYYESSKRGGVYSCEHVTSLLSQHDA